MDVSRIKWASVCILLLHINISGSIDDDVFSALSSMEILLKTETVILNVIQSYLHNEMERLKIIQSEIIKFENEHKMAIKDVTNYLANPINAFKLIKRLSIDWNNIENLILSATKNKNVKNIKNLKNILKFPTTEVDLIGATAALVRLQDIYLLDTAEISQGTMNSVQYSIPLSAHDCYVLGVLTFNFGDYHHAEQWMKETLIKYDPKSHNFMRKTDILKYLADASTEIGKKDVAEHLAKEILDINSSHDNTTNNETYYYDDISKVKSDFIMKRKKQKPDIYIIYEALCRGDIGPPESVKKNLKCRYKSTPHAFLKLAPFKIEEYYLDPYILVFHEVLSEKEIIFIKETAQRRLTRALVRSTEKTPRFSRNRISKSTWLKDSEYPIIDRISQRVSDMTGLSRFSVEHLQVVNYGIGGHYTPHYDFYRNAIKKDSDADNRLATVLFYMSDVAQGGATVFPYLGFGVQPKKGTALFWLNLFPSGEGNYGTYHAACPVLLGSKWVSNKWIHQTGQELLKPCELEFQKEGFNRKYPKLVNKVHDRK